MKQAIDHGTEKLAPEGRGKKAVKKTKREGTYPHCKETNQRAKKRSHECEGKAQEVEGETVSTQTQLNKKETVV